LTLIAGPVNDVLRNTTDSSVKSKLSTASRNIDRLARLVDSLMDFSRLEAGRIEGRYTVYIVVTFHPLTFLCTGRYIPVQFGTFVAERANVFRPVIEKASLEVCQCTHTHTSD
jgi:signal transduction histidine kinase